MLREEAVRLIQMAERMRQGRLRARFMWEIRRDEERERKVRESGVLEPDRDLAAISVQKVRPAGRHVASSHTAGERQQGRSLQGLSAGSQVEECEKGHVSA